MVSELSSEKNKTVMQAAFTIMLCFSLLITACSNVVPEAKPVSEEPVPQSESQSESSPESVVEKNLSDELLMADKKPVQEQTQEKLSQLIADGTYSDIVSYRYHGGEESMNVSITVEKDVITAASLEGINLHRASEKYVAAVNQALPDLVVGKRIDQLDIPRQISGSSLTPAAFKQYVEGLIKK